MNNRQKKILWWAFFLFVCMLSVPPYVNTFYGGLPAEFIGYSFVLWPPSVDYGHVTIDIRRLALQAMAFALTTAIVLVVLGAEKKRGE